MKPTSGHQRLRAVVGLAAFLGVAAVLLVVSAYFALIRRSTTREIANLMSTRDALQTMSDRLEAETKQALIDKRIVVSMLRLSRTAEDIPDLRGNRIVADHQNYGQLRLYVPEGSHTLEISSTWKAVPDPLASAGVNASETELAGEKTWSVPLRAACGYFFNLDSDRDGMPIQWELASNHADFKTVAETVPIVGFSQQESTWSRTTVALFPNQIERFSISGLEAAATSHPALQLMHVTLRGPRHEHRYEVTVTVRLHSDGPACISASHAQRVIIRGREDLLLPYEGSGKYDIRVSDATKIAPE